MTERYILKEYLGFTRILSCQSWRDKLSHLDLVLLVDLSAVFRISAAHQAALLFFFFNNELKKRQLGEVLGVSVMVWQLEP